MADTDPGSGSGRSPRLNAAEVTIDALVKHEWGSVLAVLVSHINDLQLAEDVLQDAVISALTHWKSAGIPDNPKAWLLRTARNRAVDHFRRRSSYLIKQSELAILQALQQRVDEPELDSAIPDERLRLMFTCCHPVLTSDAQIALTLKTLCGLSTVEIARAFILPEATMAQRLVRAKRKIRDDSIPYAEPGKRELPQRLESVLGVIYLIFNQSYSCTDYQDHAREALCNEALYLSDTLLDLLPAEPEVHGLNALLYLHSSRRAARFDDAGNLLMLDQQDRKKWDQTSIEHGNRMLKSAVGFSRVGVYTLQAAISAEHAKAMTSDATDWQAIVQLYSHLYALNPSLVVKLNRAVAVSFADGAAAGLAAMPAVSPDVPGRDELASYQPYHAAMADLHARNGSRQDAEHHYDKAITLSGSVREKAYLRAQLKALQDSTNEAVIATIEV
ncbi:MAG: sigma-70 family RNA polymerase sigma factor [Granulosicoccus sp.]